MTPEQIEAVRARLSEHFAHLGYRMPQEAIAALDHLTKSNEELRAEVEELRAANSDNGELLTIAWMDGAHRSAKGVRHAIEERGATIDRLTHDLTVTGERYHATIKERARAVAKLTMATDELETFRHDNAAMQEAIDRLTKERDEARAQFDNHVVWASGQAAELEAKVARLKKGRDSFAASYTHAAEERDEARTRLSAMQEAIDEAVRRADTETPFKTHVIVSDVVEPLRPFATKPEVEVCPVCSGDCAGANPPVIFCPMQDRILTKPEVDPLVGDETLLAELALLYNHKDDDSRQFTRWQMLVAIQHGISLAARGGRVVFDGRDG